MGINRSIDVDGTLDGQAEIGIQVRCAVCHTRLLIAVDCGDHPRGGLDIQLVTARCITDERRAELEARALAMVWHQAADSGA